MIPVDVGKPRFFAQYARIRAPKACRCAGVCGVPVRLRLVRGVDTPGASGRVLGASTACDGASVPA